MAEEETEKAEVVSPKPGRGFRRFLKFLCWCGVVALVILAGLSIVAIVAYRNLTTVVNLALAEFAAPYQIEIGDIDIGNKGRIRIDDLTVLLPEERLQGEIVPAFFEAGSIELDYDFSELKNHRKFRAIRIENPVVRIDDAKLAATKKPGEPAKEVEIGTPVLGFLGQFTDSLTVTGGNAEVALEQLPPITLDWELNTGALDFVGEEWVVDEPIEVKLSNLRVGKKGEFLKITEAGIGLRFSSDFKRMEVGALQLSDPHFRITPETLRAIAKDSGEPPEAESPQAEEGKAEVATAGALSILLEALKIERAHFELAEFESLPDVRFETSLDIEGLHYADGQIEIGYGEPVTLVLDNLEIDGRDPSDPAKTEDHLAEVRQLKAEFYPAKLIENRRLESLSLDKPVIRWNQQTASRFAGQVSSALKKAFQKPPSDSAPQEETEAENKSGAPIEIGSLAINGGRFEARDLAAGDLPLPEIQFELELALGNLVVGGPDGFKADGTQEMSLRNLRILNPQAETDEPAIFQANEIAGQLDWESFAEQKLIEKLAVEAPEFALTDRTLKPWLSLLNAPAATPAAENGTPAVEEPTPSVGDELPPIWIVNDLAVSDGVLQLDTGAFADRIPKAKGTFKVTSQASDDPASHPYRATFEQFRIRSRARPAPEPAEVPEQKPEALGGLFPGDSKEATAGQTGTPEEEVGSIRELQIDVTAEGIQREKKIDRILVDGGILNIGDGLGQLVNGEEKTAEENPDAAKPEKPAPEPEADAEANSNPQPLAAADKAPPANAQAAAAADSDPGEKKNGWRVGEFTVTRSRVQFEALIPQIAGLEFDIETSLTDIPLGGGGLLSEDHTQKVELTGIQIRDPYGGFQPVANLPTIFVEFTLAGLVEQRIDKIDLIGPELFVGEPLFQWVDYQRRFRKQNEGAGVGLEGTARPIDPSEEAGTDWEIGEINAHFGKIIIAPVGYPLGVVPFPFEATTKMGQGKIDLTLTIPDQDHIYRFPDFELDLYGLDGQVQFNVPIEQEENNLVQTFHLKRAIWKQYEAKDLWMSVSFDAEVVHGEFGGTAYDGYAEGQFNVYLKELGKWDAWIGGTNMDMGPITDVLAPENFRMDGKIDCKLVSEGKGLIFGETWGDIKTLSPGQVNVTKLDDLLKKLPDGWSMMKKSATELGLETLKEFDYEEGRADLYFVDRDGWFRLNLKGPTGSRVFSLYAHDWRKKKKTDEVAGDETKLDAAAADSSNETIKQGSINE